MSLFTSCHEVDERIAEFADRALSPEEQHALDAHLMLCANCRETVKRVRAVQDLLDNVFCDEHNPVLADRTGKWLETVSREAIRECADARSRSGFRRSVVNAQRFARAAAPWWFAACSMHLLIVALMTCEPSPKAGDEVTMVTELERRPASIEIVVQKAPLSQVSVK
jgi:anti-sigma factor RsiW